MSVYNTIHAHSRNPLIYVYDTYVYIDPHAYMFAKLDNS
jgi:hypothetical protein